MSRLDAAVAARNNAEWCDAVCRSHGIHGTFAADAWTSTTRTPPLYPDAVTLVPHVEVDDLLARIDASAGSSVKDSFASVDLQDRGFGVLFEADWIVRPAGLPPAAPVSDVEWAPVRDEAGLVAWESAWRGDDGPEGVVVPELLGPDVVVLAGRRGNQVVAGAIANAGAGVVGVSNVFTCSTPLDDAWASCLRAVNDAFPRLPVVGYEAGEALATARRHGFEPVGRLRVWVRTQA
jgi:hypothetical protein